VELNYLISGLDAAISGKQRVDEYSDFDVVLCLMITQFLLQ